MKKYLFFLAMLSVASMLTVSCSKDDDEDPQEASLHAKLDFANKLTQGSTRGVWEGRETCYRKSWGNWSDDGTKFVVWRFDRASTSAVEGTGWMYVFEDAWYEHLREKGEFKWDMTDNVLQISYRNQGWEPLHAEYKTSELVVSGDKFDGTWFVSSDWKYEFHYTKSGFSNWDL